MNEGRPEMVDAHVHFWDVETQQRGWITGEWDSSQEAYLGDYSPLKRTFLLEDLLPLYAAARVAKLVHVQADWGGDDQVEETTWVAALGASVGFPLAIVAGADLRAPGASDELERHCAAGPVRGVRMLSYYENLFEDPAFLCGLTLLEHFGLVFEIGVMWDRLDDALALARRRQNVQFVLDHVGMPVARDRENLARWRQGLRAIAECDNVVVKISGLGMGRHPLNAQEMGPLVIDALEAFGAGRSMLGSNWPVDSLFGQFDELIKSFEQITENLSATEEWALWRGTAERVYRI
jgi:predicted TIM-barrel fold metal-dependent hydrolase